MGKIKVGTLIVTVDTNDADFIEESYAVTQAQLVRWKGICEKLKPYKDRYQVRIEDYDAEELRDALEPVLTKEEIETLIDGMPKGEYGYATLESIEFIPALKERLL